MNQLQIFTAEQERPQQRRYITHFYSKKDVMQIWGIFDYPQFLSMIGEEGKRILGWTEGKQRFTPNQVRELIRLVGMPLQKGEY